MDGYVVMDPRLQVYISLYDFQTASDDELSFTVGERFHVLDRTGDWWLVNKLNAQGHKTREKGYVPFNYLAKEDPLEDQPWYFGELSRTEAVQLLLKEGNKTGSFLVRVSDKQSFPYALSARYQNSVKNFKIQRNDEKKLYLNSQVSFPDLLQLVMYYQTRAVSEGLTLTSPCIKDESLDNDLSSLAQDEWERSRDEFTLVKKLGSGNFAQVHEGYWKGRVQMKVAIKVIKKDVTTRETFKKETAFLKTLHHRNLLSLYAVCSVGDPFYIVTELMPKGDLLNFLRAGEGEQLPVDALLDITQQIVDGMQYLESRNCIHRDLAARNILVGNNNICKVADFGLARIVQEDFYQSKSTDIPYRWTAPEALAFGRYSIKSDVWSFGILLYEIMSRGMNPYAGMSNTELLPFLQQGKRLSIPPNCSKKVYDVMLECWKEDPNERPSFSFLKGILENLSNYEVTDCSPIPANHHVPRRGKR